MVCVCEAVWVEGGRDVGGFYVVVMMELSCVDSTIVILTEVGGKCQSR
jgi:hypothetical protein